MAFDQDSNVVISVSRVRDNRWQVTVEDGHQALASFASPHDACAWAIALAKPKRGRVYVEETIVDYTSVMEESERRSVSRPAPPRRG